MEIFTDEEINCGNIDRPVRCWPNLFPVQDAVDPDVPTVKHIKGTVVATRRGNECMLNRISLVTKEDQEVCTRPECERRDYHLASECRP